MTTQTELFLLDANGDAQPMLAEVDGSGRYIVHSTPDVAGAAVSVTNPLPVTTGLQGGGSWLAATVAAGATDQILFGADTTRVRYTITNQDGTNGVWFKWNGAATIAGSGCFFLAAGATIDRAGFGINQTALHMIAAAGTPNVYFEKYW